MIIVYMIKNNVDKNVLYLKPFEVCDRVQLAYFLYTQQKSHILFRAVENGIKQCFAAHIVRCCQHYCSALLHLVAG